jgi:hypothetical protein
MLERKGKIETKIISDQEETRTNLQGETITRGTRTLKGEITTNTKERTKKIFGQTSLVPFAVSMSIILTIAPKSQTSNR